MGRAISSSGELALLLILANMAQDEDRVEGSRHIAARTCFPGIDYLAELMRMGPDGVRKVLRKVEDRGLRVRVSVGVDKSGRPVYAAKGHATVYRIPELSKGGTTVPPLNSKGETTGRAMDSKGGTTGLQRRDNWTAKAGTTGWPQR